MRVLLIIAALFSSLPALAGNSGSCMRLVSSFGSVDRLIVPTLSATFKAHGTCIEVTYAPPKRATVLMNTGQIDGVLIRTASYHALVKQSAFPVPEAILTGYGLLLTNTPSPENLDGLKNMRLGVMADTQWQQELLGQNYQTVEISDYKSGLAMLKARRLDGLLIDNISYGFYSEQTEGFEVVRVTPELDAFLFLAHTHAEKSEQCNAAIKTWKRVFMGQLKSPVQDQLVLPYLSSEGSLSSKP
ncbi:ABC-type amino acid transport substrate-binding protein [Roseibium hamelinense]|uniref:ABC-type amino acid transport substrate-binding protein n=1 Tax=Roseibium hamelinense TaxID=150831 RepID=A0A562T982_9HYPH|nr:hypothetical protein [Roseibium hamelinense]MTI45447.1 hypothetical protein [Roseibium hamelinense]TWI90181.1 ABC-type amino acid transport substrate-binding protein [Roseibium hamelinense]